MPIDRYLGEVWRVFARRWPWFGALLGLALAPGLTIAGVALVTGDEPWEVRVTGTGSGLLVGWDGGWSEVVSLGGLGLLFTGLGLASALGGLTHLAYRELVGEPPDVESSLRWGIRRLPRILTGVGVLLVVSGLAGFVVVTAAAASGWLLIVAVPAAIVLAVVLYGRLALFVPAAALGSPGTGTVGASWDLTQGRFWAVFGRALLLAVIVNFVSTLATGPLQVFGLLLPSSAQLVTAAVLTATLGAAGFTVLLIGPTVLYVDLAGELDPALAPAAGDDGQPTP